MRILNSSKLIWNKKFIIYYIIVICLAVISGIVLFITNNLSSNFYNFTKNYIYFIFNFDNVSLFFGHLLSDLFYFYIAFLICYFTKFKFLTGILLFIKTFFTTYYLVVLFVLFSVEGIIAALIVFLPCYVLWVVKFSFLCMHLCIVEKPFIIYLPLIFAILDGVFLLFLVNLVFRFIVVIV